MQVVKIFFLKSKLGSYSKKYKIKELKIVLFILVIKKLVIY